MAKDLLLEIGMEEAPASYLSDILTGFQNKVTDQLNAARIAYQKVEVKGTPRRMVLMIRDLAEMQEDRLIESRGPKKQAAFDAEGNPTKAVLGFSRSQGVAVEDLEVREVSGVAYMFAVKSSKGEKTEDFISNLLLEALASVNLPKSMRWGYHHMRFIRPIRWILALYGQEILPMKIENIESSNQTYGHRFLAPEAISIQRIDDYEKVLREHYVIVDQQERKERIWEQVQQVAAGVGGQARPDEDLLEQLCYLVEYPTAFYGEFSSSYLEVPVEVLTTSMIENQKYFPVFDPDGKLMPGFIGVRNGTDFRLDLVREGNQRVIKARLEDALFFWKEDTRKKLETYTQKFPAVTFHEKLGSLQDKVERLRRLAVWIGEKLHLSDSEKSDRAAFLCKADLMTSMVYEFPELQGVMGRYYAQLSGEDSEVAEAILEHYMPRFSGDALPKTPTGIVLSLAEKIDNLTGCFIIGVKPSGSQDPYALRRQALGIVNIILERGLDLDLREWVRFAYEGFEKVEKTLTAEQTAEEIVDFILQRLRGVLLDKGFRHDVIDAVLALRSGEVEDDVRKVAAITDYRTTPFMDNFMTVFNRSHNLSKKWEGGTTVKMEYLTDPTEIKLYTQFIAILPAVGDCMECGDYTSAMDHLGRLRYALDQFFDAVMVMDEDENVRGARLSMLKSISQIIRTIADFSLLTA